MFGLLSKIPGFFGSRIREPYAFLAHRQVLLKWQDVEMWDWEHWLVSLVDEKCQMSCRV